MIENSWFYFFSSLAQTIASCSALLVAIAVIRLQNFDNLLNIVERTIAEAVFNIDEQENYRKHALVHFRNEKWLEYFCYVENLANDNFNKFSTSLSGDYTRSKEFMDSLIEQGRNLEDQKHQLNNALTYAFGGTILFAGAAILAIPVAQWICPCVLWIAWSISGILLIILFAFYIRLILNIWKPKKWRTENDNRK